jgi:D-alanyl-D-alanine carboxypeptidase
MAEQNPSYAWSAGGIVSTAADLNHFYGALLTGQLLPPKELAAMLTVEDGSGGYGLGICRIQLADGTALWGHTGEIFGYLTISYHSPGAQRQLTISCTTTDAPAPDTETVLQALSAQQSSQSGTTAHWALRDNA